MNTIISKVSSIISKSSNEMELIDLQNYNEEYEFWLGV